MEDWADEGMNGQIERWLDELEDRWMDGWTDR